VSLIHEFSARELRDLDRQGVGKVMRRNLLKLRQIRLFHETCTPDEPDWRLKGGGVQAFVEPLEATIADGTQISNSTSETIVVPDFNIPAYYMAAGRTLRITAYGVNSNVVTTPGTLTFRVRWGGVAGTVLLASAAIVMDVTARTNAFWYLACTITCRTAGSSGTFISGGYCFIVNQKGSVAVASNAEFNAWVMALGSAGTPIASANAAVTVNTTTANLLSVTATESVSTSPTNLTCNSLVLEILN
jgi:hypothetical protein